MNDKVSFQIIDIIRGTTVDGPGFRTSIYFAGCVHKCKGCHNPHSWDPDTGITMSLDEIMEVIREEDFDVTLTGGDPLYHPDAITKLILELKKEGRNIWLYTGYTWEEICKNGKLFEAVKNVDVIVDGPFVSELKDPDLQFRGSSNQRIIQVKKEIIKN